MYELEYVRFRINPSINLNHVCNISIALLESGRVAGVHPEHPRLWRLFSNLVGIFDGKLRLPHATQADKRSAAGRL